VLKSGYVWQCKSRSENPYRRTANDTRWLNLFKENVFFLTEIEQTINRLIKVDW
jgi:hypothetical protein